MAGEGYVHVPGRVWSRSGGEGGVLLLCPHGGPGRFVDECRPARMTRRVPGAHHLVIEDASPLCSAEQRELLTALTDDLLGRTERRRRAESQ